MQEIIFDMPGIITSQTISGFSYNFALSLHTAQKSVISAQVFMDGSMQEIIFDMPGIITSQTISGFSYNFS